MKKILLVVTLLMLFVPSLVFADTTYDSFYEGEYLNGAYIKKFKKGASTGKYEQMRMFRRTSDNTFAYCIELWESLKSGVDMLEHSYNYLNYTNIGEEKWKKIELISYYGYGYQNHTNNSWYVATQFLIWQTISDDSIIYFTDTLNGNKTDKFVAEMNEINTLVNNHYKYPSFNGNTYEVNLNEEFILNDTNNILNEYEIITSSNNFSVEKANNTLKVKANTVSNFSIKLTKGNYRDSIKLYTNPNGQDLIVRGNYTSLVSKVDFNTLAGKIYLTKVDNETYLSVGQGDAKIENTKYTLYDSNMNIVQDLIIDKNGKAESNYLPYGTYYLKEKEAGLGYNLDDDTYTINLTKDVSNYYLTLKNRVIRGKIIVYKEYEPLNTNKHYPEKNILFKIYDSNNNFVSQFTTDSDGYGETILPYGKYLVKQISTLENYNKIDDFSIFIGEEKEYHYNLLNKEKGSSLIIYKKDKETKLPIRLSNTKFMIKNKTTNNYVSNDNQNVFETVDGKLVLPFKLGIGQYELIEVEAPIGYKKNDVPYEFSVTDNDDNKTSVIDIYNDKDYQRIQLLKVGETIDGTNNIPLSNVWFSLYASEDVVSGDGKIHYHKGDLIEKNKTDENGYITFNNLLYGNYYILENTTLDSYIIDTNKYYININQSKTYHIDKINYLKRGNLIIKKIDGVSKRKIPNVLYELYDINSKLLMKIKTDLDGEIYIPNLVLGTYYLKEVYAPYPYIIDNSIKKIDITTTDSILKITLENDKVIEEDVPNTSIDTNSSFLSVYLIGIAILFLILYILY